LPRAAITTLVLEKPPATATKKVVVGTRTEGKATDPKRVPVAVELLTREYALGATDVLELAWEPPTMVATAAPTATADVVVRLDDSQVETTAKLRLRGPAKSWQIALPLGADVTASSESGGVAPAIVRPPDPNRQVWTIRGTGDGPADWLLTVTARQARPKPHEAKFRGPYPLGPYTVLGPAKQSGTLSVFAPPTARLGFKSPADFRRQDVLAEDGQVAAFQYTSLPPLPNNGKTPPWMDLDARSVPAVARVRPAHALTLRSDGWHWEAVVKVIPPPRGEVEQVMLALPAGWETLTAKPEDVVDEVQAISDGGSVRTRLIRLIAPQKAAFELILTSRFPVPLMAGKLSLPLPYFPQTDEREGIVSATVPEEFEVSGTVAGEPLQPPAGRRPPITTVSGLWDRAAEKVELNWPPHRPDIACATRAEVTVFGAQTVVTQVLKFKTPGDGKPILLRGPSEAVGLNSVPEVYPVAVALGEWEFRPPAQAEFTLTLGYALRHPAGPPTAAELPVGLFTPVRATRLETTARVWSAAPGRRLDGYAGAGWRELPPEPAADRDILPTFTLTATGNPPLGVRWTMATDTGPTVVVDRALILAVLGEDGTAAVRGRFVLSRWPAGGVELAVPADAVAVTYADGKRLTPQPGSRSPHADSRTMRLLLPTATPGRAVTFLDVRYSRATPRDGAGGRVLVPPALLAATHRTPTRWHVVTPAGSVSLFPDADWQPNTCWGWNGLGIAPTAGVTAADLERWLAAGTTTDAEQAKSWTVPDGGETTAAAQAVPGKVTVFLVPRVGWVAGVSAGAFLFGLLASRLRARWLGPLVALLGVGVAVGAAVAPQPAAKVIAAAQPGVLLLAVLLLGSAAWRWYARRRIERLPSFRRSRGTTAAAPNPPQPSGTGRSSRGPSAEVSLEPEVGSAR